MTAQEIDIRKAELRKKVDKLIAIKEELYSGDISMPMSSEEKQLNREISAIFSELNGLVMQKRSLLKS